MDSSLQGLGDIAVSQSSTAKLGAKMRSGDADKTSKDFAAMFMGQMLQPMFESMQVDPNFGGGHGEQVMRTFLVQEYGKIAAKSDGFGIAAAVKNEMIRAQSINANQGASNGTGQ